MAGKHSKSFFDFRKNVLVTGPKTKEQAPISLPFKIIIVFLIASLSLSLVFVGTEFLPSVLHKNMLRKAARTFSTNKSHVGLEMLSQQNPDIKAWLKIDKTNINYAVCQNADDSYYTNHNQRGKKSRYGALTMSSNDDITRQNGDKNIVIFGNNMRDGSMFGSLKEYRKLDFYKQHPLIRLYHDDIWENYVVFSVMLLSASADDSVAFKPYKSHFADEQEFNNWYSETVVRSLINTTIDIKHGDDLLTLVTVAKDFDGARLVVMAKKVDDWTAERIDVSNASVNAKIKYPQVWYTQRGLQYPY